MAVPSVSKKQHNLMAMVAHDPAAAKRLGIKQSVGKEFVNADKGKSFKRGGEMAKVKSAPGATPMGKVKTAAPSRDGIAERGHTRAKPKDSGKIVGIQSGARRGK
jgi:hypothetical protein